MPMPAETPIQQHDVIVMGGGLAGLTLALQLGERMPGIDILVVERRAHPVPEAAHKVGESSVEIGAHYFDTVLGLKNHLETRQLRKFGFRFFFCDRRSDIDQVVELGASRHLSTPSYQIDRGIFENFLGETARQRGVRFIDGASIRDFTIADDGMEHSVRYEHAGVSRVAQARWLIDASGRAGLIKRRLGLAEDNGHEANAAWFRIGSRIDVNDWSEDADWLGRCTPPSRWLSTNHLVGPGYCVWLIPLSSGSHSVGIVADSSLHSSRSLDSFDKSLDWLSRHQPRLAKELEDKRHLLQDFAFLRRFSYGCKQVFSAQRWALTGEAGVFLDPFYSPGSDFIAISNTYITELIAGDRAGEPVARLARLYEQFYFSFYESTLTLYRGQYPMFGDPEVFPVKVLWDYAYYWGVLCQIFFQRRLADLAALSALRDELTGSKALNLAMQAFLRQWSVASHPDNGRRMLDQARLPWFAELNRGLRDKLDDGAFEQRIRATSAQLRALAREIVATAQAAHPGLDASAVQDALRGWPVETDAVPMLMMAGRAAMQAPAASHAA
jgi:flavin-dependent dehydrogenase